MKDTLQKGENVLDEMFNYFETENICLSCNNHVKHENQIVCDTCYLHECLPEWLEGD